ncbi:MAG: hypothetical protein H6883_14110 [Rhodobiaceae bacterium]|nr:hypothetical protein [Rhodobiaceae bacterium]
MEIFGFTIESVWIIAAVVVAILVVAFLVNERIESRRHKRRFKWRPNADRSMVETMRNRNPQVLTF